MGRGLSLARHPIGCLKCTEGTEGMDVLQEGRKGREGESEDPSTSSGRGATHLLPLEEIRSPQ